MLSIFQLPFLKSNYLFVLDTTMDVWEPDFQGGQTWNFPAPPTFALVSNEMWLWRLFKNSFPHLIIISQILTIAQWSLYKTQTIQIENPHSSDRGLRSSLLAHPKQKQIAHPSNCNEWVLYWKNLMFSKIIFASLSSYINVTK